MHRASSTERNLPSTGNIDETLLRLAASARRASRRRMAVLSGAGVLVATTVALVAAELGLGRVALGVLVAGVLGAGAALGWESFRGAGRAGVEAIESATARLAESLAPELGTAASSAVDFGRQLAREDVRYSRELAREHVDRTTRSLAAIDLGARLAARQRLRQRRPWMLLGASAAVTLVALVALGQGRRRLVGMVTSPGAAQLVDVPLAADIRITYHHPAYTGLPDRVVEGGDGSVSAVAGTEVVLEASADEDIRGALFELEPSDGTPPSALPMRVDGRKMSVRFQLTKDGRYHFALVTRGGDELEERGGHALHAVPDAYPEVTMLSPVTDVELRDDKAVPVLWAAKDDFGVGRVELVVEVPGAKEPRRLTVSGGDRADAHRDGTYSWHVAELGLAPGTEARFYLEATDNDAISGPKRAVSASRKLTLFSARKHHEDLVARQQHVLDALVDWLGAELVEPYPPSGAGAAAHLTAQQHILDGIRRLGTELATLVPLVRDDELAGPAIASAFANVREHVQRAERGRSQLLLRLGGGTARPAGLHQALAREQQRAVAELEKDTVYLDDLLAIQRIDTLKQTAKDLLAAQRELQRLLGEYKRTQDPALRAELTKRIAELKDQMLGLLAKMADIKQQLPGEYRNLESASQLAVDDQLDRLEKALAEGNLDDAAAQLEQLADMIENMSERLGRAEEAYGGERYAEVREQLRDFARQFEQLEGEQKAVARRSDELARKLRDETLKRAGASIDQFVQKARGKTREALAHLDEVQIPPTPYGLASPLDQARQRLLDLDSLLGQKDFSEALRSAEDALRSEGELGMSLDARWGGLSRYGQASPEMARSAEATSKAQKRTQEVASMLEKLFPDPGDVLSKQQLEQMKAASRRQAKLEQRAGELGQKMDELAQQVPLFGGEPRASLESARGEMGQAADDLGQGELPGGAQHGRLAADELGKLRQALEQASKQGQGGGLPLPLAMQGAPRGGEGGQSGVRNEDVNIPAADKNRAAPQFRKELMEAAKQKAPQHYEDAVRRYYEELIR